MLVEIDGGKSERDVRLINSDQGRNLIENTHTHISVYSCLYLYLSSTYSFILAPAPPFLLTRLKDLLNALIVFSVRFCVLPQRFVVHLFPDTSQYDGDCA